jgi:hypothetical protein
MGGSPPSRRKKSTLRNIALVALALLIVISLGVVLISHAWSYAPTSEGVPTDTTSEGVPTDTSFALAPTSIPDATATTPAIISTSVPPAATSAPTTVPFVPTAVPSPTEIQPVDTPIPTATTPPPPPATATVTNFAYTPSIVSCYLSFDIYNTSNVVASNVYYTDAIAGNGVTVSGGASVGDIAAGGSVHQSFPVNFVNFNGIYTDITISVYEYGQGGTNIGGGSATIQHC